MASRVRAGIAESERLAGYCVGPDVYKNTRVSYGVVSDSSVTVIACRKGSLQPFPYVFLCSSTLSYP